MHRLSFAMSPLVRLVLGRLTWVAVLGAGAASLLGFAAGADWRLELLCHFRVQYFWALALATVVQGLCQRPYGAVVAGALAVLNASLIVPLYFGPAQDASVAGQAVRGMALNVYWLNDEHERVLELVLEEKPDFVLFVEVTPQWQQALMTLESDYLYWHAEPRKGTTGMAIYSRYPMEPPKLHFPGPSAAPVLVATIDLPDGPLTVIGVHTASPGSRENAALRNAQLAELGVLAAEIQGPKILLGDLNLTSWSPYFKRLLKDSGLADSRLGFGVQGSWPALPQPLRIPIDHILVSREIRVVDRHTTGAVSSDHRGVVIAFGSPRP